MGADGSGISRFDGRTFKTFSKTDGLSDNVVRSLLEDSKGNIWIGTDNGLTLYNGFSFRAIGKKQGFKGSSVLKIMEGSNGIIWAATNDAGITGLIPGDSLKMVSYSSSNGLVSDFVFDIYEDAGNRLWLGMVGGLNIIEFEDGTCTKIKNIAKPEIERGQTVNILSIEPGDNGIIWLGSLDNGLWSAIKVPGRTGYQISPSAVNKEFPELRIWDMMNTGKGELWIATDKNGVIRLKNGELSGFFDRRNGLLSNQILDIMKDNEGNIWFASFGQGAMMYRDDKFIFYNEGNGIEGSQIFDILFAPERIFYLATDAGLLRFRKEGTGIKRLNSFSSRNGLIDAGANVVENSSDNRVWIGTNKGINILSGSGISAFEGNKALGNSTINAILSDRQGNIWIGTAGGYGKISGDKLFFMSQEQGLINDEIQTIIEDRKGRIWLGTMGGLVKLEGKNYTDYNETDGLTNLKVYSLAEDPVGNIWIGTSDGGIFKFDISKDTVPISAIKTSGTLSSAKINSLKFICDTLAVAGNDKGFDLLVLNSNMEIKRTLHYGINDGFTGGENNSNSIASDDEGNVWFGTKKGLIRYNPSLDFNNSFRPITRITGIKLFFENTNWRAKGFKTERFSELPEQLILSYKNNHLTFSYTAFSYNDQDDLEFSYFLVNQSHEWSPFSKSREVLFQGLTPGKYKLMVVARNKNGISGPDAEYSFIIRPPFWKTTWFLVTSFIIVVIGLMAVIRIREGKLIKEKIKLENIVVERTREIVEQKDEIARQRDVVTYQKKEITDSIHYAERIQKAVLPESEFLRQAVSDHFILFRPKDIVSGDFYWMSRKDDKIIFSAADCTGHGVPGAFMSMLGVSFLNKIVNESGIVKPSEILNQLRSNIISALKQQGTSESTKDGMDIALCSVDIINMKLSYAGANNPLFLIRRNGDEYELDEIKGDKMPVGVHSRMDDFTNHEIIIRKGDTIYLFSDGILDQFGGPEGRKFMKPRFRQMLLENQALPLAEQKKVFGNTITEWMNYKTENREAFGQIDDILLLGIRI